jgi:hypothetical protein
MVQQEFLRPLHTRPLVVCRCGTVVRDVVCREPGCPGAHVPERLTTGCWVCTPDAQEARGAHRGPCTIAGAGDTLWQETTARYVYTDDPGHCPICGGVGIPWDGWFHCDGACHAIAVVADGRTFLPVPKAT